MTRKENFEDTKGVISIEEEQKIHDEQHESHQVMAAAHSGTPEGQYIPTPHVVKICWMIFIH